MSFGDLQFENAGFAYFDSYLAWFDFWLRSRGDGLASLPPYSFYMMGESQWLTSTEWPPADSREERWYLSSAGRANSRRGDGRLERTASAVAAVDEYRSDPADPVPTRGGAICCTGDPTSRQGHIDQSDVEERDDVLVYTTPALDQPLRIAGPLRAHLVVSSSAKDTDFVARLVHVWPDGRATNIQEGALRARYRNGIAQPKLLTPGEAVELTIDMRATAYTIPVGHRLRLDVASSSFPRLERNLNTGGANFDESVGIVAVNRIHHSPVLPSHSRLHTLPTPEGRTP